MYDVKLYVKLYLYELLRTVNERMVSKKLDRFRVGGVCSIFCLITALLCIPSAFLPNKHVIFNINRKNLFYL